MVMLAVGALLLTASGGYYAYAQFVKTGRADLVHEVPRPTFPNEQSSGYADTQSRPGVGLSNALEAAEEAGSHDATVADTDNPFSSKRKGAVQRFADASLAASDSTVGKPVAGSADAERISMIAERVDGRTGAAMEELLNLQARRPGYVVKDDPEDQADPQHDGPQHVETSESSNPGVRVIRPSEDRNPTTKDRMVAALLESDYSRAAHTAPEPEYATRITVPGIGLIAAVEELEVVEDEDSRAWETPKHVVGHIPTTAKPGTSGQGWYFGHLESPISGEGNVFRRLPELAVRFKRGEQFAIHLDAGGERYVYQVYRTDVVHASEFAVSDSGLNDITLVSCWPQYEYSERVLVTAALVDVVDIAE